MMFGHGGFALHPHCESFHNFSCGHKMESVAVVHVDNQVLGRRQVRRKIEVLALEYLKGILDVNQKKPSLPLVPQVGYCD